jgi:hypothetical protein
VLTKILLLGKLAYIVVGLAIVVSVAVVWSLIKRP